MSTLIDKAWDSLRTGKTEFEVGVYTFNGCLVRVIKRQEPYQYVNKSGIDKTKSARYWGSIEFPNGVKTDFKSQRGGADRDYLEGAQDIHEADIEFQKRVREIYRQQCEIDPKFIRIDCSDEYGQMLPPDEIFAKVKEVVDQAVNRI